MTKFWDITIKNLKTMFRDKKGILFILIPVFFYCLMGLVFGGADFDNDPHIYQVGWLDLDSTESNDAYLNNSYFFEVLDDVENINMILYEENETAIASLKSHEIDAFIIIPDGFELYVNDTGPKPSESLQIYFRTSTSSVSKSIITETILGVIDSIVNYNPTAKQISYTQQIITGESINAITSGTPGYLMYGILSSLSTAVILIVAPIFKTPEASGGGVWLILIPLMTFSGAFFPLEIVAPSIIPYVGWIPTRIAVILFQSFMLDSVSLWDPSIWNNFALMFGESLLLFLIGIKLYKKFAQS